MTNPLSDRLVMAVEVTHFARMDNSAQVAVKQALSRLLGQTEDNPWITPVTVEIRDHGDGAIVVLSPGDAAVEHGASLLAYLSAQLPEHNRDSGFRLRLRVAVAYGPVEESDGAFTGRTVTDAMSLVDSDILRLALQASSKDLVWVASEQMERGLLHHSPELLATHAGLGTAPTTRAQTLGNDGFVDQGNALARLDALAEGPDPRVAMIVGPTGVGKTTLLARWIQRAADSFPEGRYHVSTRRLLSGMYPSLRSERSLAEVLADVLRDRGVPESEIADDLSSNLDTFRGLGLSRRVLVVFDEVDPHFDPGLALELANAGPMVVVIGRRLENRPDFATVIELGALPLEEALRFLRAALGQERMSQANKVTWASLAFATAALPMPLAIAASVLATVATLRPESLVKEIERRTLEHGDVVSATLEIAYRRLGPEASSVLKAASLSDASDITPDLMAFLLEENSEYTSKGLRELVTTSLLNARDDGTFYYAHLSIREFAYQKLTDEEPPDTIDRIRNRVDRYFLLQFGRKPNPEPKITRDFWTIEDRLSHQRYADAIAAFVRHHETQPPLTIGIKAPWGAGKTSLMRMIQDNLDPGAGTKPRRLRLTAASESRAARRTRGDADPSARVTNGELFRTTGHSEDEAAEPAKARLSPDGPSGTDWRPTVWFNPWMYQNGEQVWAGLAHEIISQITSRMSVGDRERFWLRLNLARIDREAVRQKWYRLLLSRMLPLITIWFATLLVAAVALLWVWLLPGAQEAVARWFSATTVTGGTLVLIGGGLMRVRSYLRDPASGSLGSLVSAPDPLGNAVTPLANHAGTTLSQSMTDPGYTARIGFLHLVQTDMRRVLDLVADENRPLVVFIDDLDRCSSGTVAQVIEAINLFLAGQFPNCVFIAGMDPGAVAAHVEVSHQDLVTAEREGRFSGDLSTLGWRFLGKFVQLPLSLPSTRDEQDVKGYLQALMGARRTSAPAPPPTEGPRSATAPDEVSAKPTPALPAKPSPSTTPPQDGIATVTSAEPPDEADIAALVAAIRRRNPTLDDLRSVTLEAQREVLDQPSPLTPAALRAADRVFGDLYRDTDSQDVLTDGVTQLASNNPREIKRYVNLFRFYTFISQRHRLEGLPALSPEQAAQLAALTIRWPHVLSLLQHTGAEHPVVALERAARAEDDEAWREALANAAPAPNGISALSWAASLRTFLANGPELGPEAARLI